MSAKAKQGMRALAQAGFNLRKLRIVLDIHQKAVNGKLENMEKESEALNKRVKKALQATMKILGDATKKAARTLSEVTGNSPVVSSSAPFIQPGSNPMEFPQRDWSIVLVHIV